MKHPKVIIQICHYKTQLVMDIRSKKYCNPLSPARVSLYNIIYLISTHCIFLIFYITPLPFYSISYLTFILSLPLYIYFVKSKKYFCIIYSAIIVVYMFLTALGNVKVTVVQAIKLF